jgi:serine/threonine-protein kinase
LLEQLVSALAFAQENGVCHRDIKPSNLFLTEAGLYKVGDFGCAKAFDNSALGYTMAGTPLYLSPILRKAFTQQLLGQEVGQVDHNPYKSDVYSLGLTLVYLLSPSSKSILGNQSELSKIIATLPIHPNFQTILRLMLEVDEVKRPDFLELSTALQGWKTQFKRERLCRKPRYLSEECE